MHLCKTIGPAVCLVALWAAPGLGVVEGEPQVSLSTDQSTYIPGDTFVLSVEIQQGTQHPIVDGWVWVDIPGGTRAYLRPDLMTFGTDPAPTREDFTVVDLAAPIVQMDVPDMLPPGVYTFSAAGADLGFDPFVDIHRVSNVASTAATLLLPPVCSELSRFAEVSTVSLERVFSNLSFDRPVALFQAPGDTERWFVVEQGGRVLVFADDPQVDQAEVFIDIRDRVDDGPSEAGLLGMAFHPDFAENHQVFLSYTRSGDPLVSYVSRFISPDGGKTLDPDSETPLLTLDQPFGNHNGGGIGFGPDGYLYIGFGDGGSGGDPDGNGQNTHTLLGAMLRIDVDSATPYAIPPDNPFAQGGGRGEIYAWGLRNPWRWSFDRSGGALWVGDVGQNQWEEIDRVERGGNYGWNIREGRHCFPSAPCDSTGLIDPVTEYSHAEGCSVTGGYVYRGMAIPALQGVYLYGDFCSGRLWGLACDAAGTPATRVLQDTGLLISSFAEGHDGEVYVLDYSGGGLYRVAP